MELNAAWLPSQIPAGVVCDNDSDCFKMPAGPLAEGVPALVYLSCTGGKPWDIDSVAPIFDSLGWAIATCGKSRNHRSGALNERDILRTIAKLSADPRIDDKRIVLFGFSGQGAEALGVALRHPDLVAGAITDCAHLGGVTRFDPIASRDQLFYIITREKDWNREHSELLHANLVKYGIADTLVTTPGEHGIGPASEILDGCSWMAAALHQRVGIADRKRAAEPAGNAH